MPGMIRPDNKAKKIAYAILGTPENMKTKKDKKHSIKKDPITFQEPIRN